MKQPPLDSGYIHAVKAANKTRKFFGLSEIKFVTRKCLKCNVEFKSTNKRLCNHCTTASKDYYEE